MTQYILSKDLFEFFDKKITVEMICEPFLAMPIDTDKKDLLNIMEKKNFDILGIEENKRNIGYIKKKEMINSDINDSIKIHHFQIKEILSHSSPLLETIKIMEGKRYLFIIRGNHVEFIITQADLQKIPVRLLIFGFVTVFEHFMTQLISKNFPNDSWKIQFLENNDIIENAKNLYKLKKENNEEISLLECLNLAPKVKLFLKILEETKIKTLKSKFTNFPSKRNIKSALFNMEVIRNQIFHSQEKINLESKERMMKMLIIIEQILHAKDIIIK